MQQVGDATVQMAAGFLPELLGYGGVAPFAEEPVEVAQILLVQEVCPQDDRERGGTGLGVPSLFAQPAKGTDRKGVDDVRVGPAEVVSAGAPSSRLRPVPRASGQGGAEDGVTHRGVVGVGRRAEFVLEPLEQWPYEAELRTQKRMFGLQ
ncbi:hypothetical protein [Streptomyces parvulus]|uniref:hypothetical protein n=1 Tax=Streptomyces parvulus TaxID=146923 RepID=UPI0033CF1173